MKELDIFKEQPKGKGGWIKTNEGSVAADEDREVGKSCRSCLLCKESRFYLGGWKAQSVLSRTG